MQVFLKIFQKITPRFLVLFVFYQILWYYNGMIEIKFAENLKNLRMESGLTQKKLAEMIGVDQRTVSAWERGTSQPSLEMLALLCEIFEENFDGLLA